LSQIAIVYQTSAISLSAKPNRILRARRAELDLIREWHFQKEKHCVSGAFPFGYRKKLKCQPGVEIRRAELVGLVQKKRSSGPFLQAVEPKMRARGAARSASLATHDGEWGLPPPGADEGNAPAFVAVKICVC
jgi:hypothetical protein